MKCLLCKQSVKQPVVTRCGHMYCWNCIRNPLPRPCPQCGLQITKETLTSIYGDNSETPAFTNTVEQHTEQQDFHEENNQFENNDFENNFEERPAQHYEEVNDGRNIIRRMREYHETMQEDQRRDRLTEEEKSQLYSLPKWVVYVIVSLLVFFMIMVFIFGK